MVAFRTLDPFAAVRAEGDDAVHAPSMPGAATEGPVTLATSTGPS